MRLSEYFDTRLDSQLVTVASPTVEQMVRLTFTCCQADKVRRVAGILVITSGLRPPKSKYSQHQDGYAIDFVPKETSINIVFEWILANLEFDQVIIERNKQGAEWIHLSAKPYGNRKQALVGVWCNTKEKMVYDTFRP